MHIIMVSRVLPFHSIGGMQVITWDLAKEFTKRGLRVTCITTSIKGYSSNFRVDDVDVVALADTPSGVHSKAWWTLSKLYVQEHFMDDCDVLFSVSAGGFSILGLKPQMRNTIFVFQAHGTSLSEIASKLKLHTIKSLLSIVKNIKWLPIDLIKYKQFDGLISAGERVNRDFEGWLYSFFLKNKSTIYIPNGIDTVNFRPSNDRRADVRTKLDLSDTDFVILIASRLHKQKGIEQAIDAFYKYSLGNNAQLLIVGSGPNENNAKKMVLDLGISKNVHFISSVSLEELPKYLNASDVYLFPTLHEEGLPLLPLEALACGIPVLASCHLKEINECSDFVISVDPRNIDSIVKGISHSKSIVANEQSFLSEKYTIEGVVTQYLSYFTDLKNEKK